MAVVDTKAWKQFRLGDLFGSALHGNWVNPKLLDEDDAGYCIVSASTVENGVGSVRYACPDSKNLIPSGVITWGKQSPFFAYQPESTISGQGVYFYKVGALSERAALFLCSVMQAVVASRYNYQDCLIGEKCDNEVVMLPATPDGQPDWAYMDAYMSEVLKKEEVFAEHLASLTAEAVADGHKLDTSGWKAFRIGDLFEKLSLGFKADRKFDKALDVDTEPSDEFDLPLVNAKDGDNGVMYWGRSSDWDSVEMTLDIVQNGAVATGNVYAQPQRTGVLFDAYLVKPKMQVSENVLQYLAVVTERCVKQHFSYFNKCTWDRVSELSIYLPVTPAGEPDWAFMEQYMQQQMDKAAKLVDHLDAVWNS